VCGMAAGGRFRGASPETSRGRTCPEEIVFNKQKTSGSVKVRRRMVCAAAIRFLGERLEGEFQSQLEFPWIVNCPRDFPKSRGAYQGIRPAKVRMVEGVEGLRAELQVRAFVNHAQREVLEQRHGEVTCAWLANMRVGSGSTAIGKVVRRCKYAGVGLAGITEVTVSRIAVCNGVIPGRSGCACQRCQKIWSLSKGWNIAGIEEIDLAVEQGKDRP